MSFYDRLLNKNNFVNKIVFLDRTSIEMNAFLGLMLQKNQLKTNHNFTLARLVDPT